MNDIPDTVLVTQYHLRDVIFLSVLWSLYSSFYGQASTVAFGIIDSVKTLISKLHFNQLKLNSIFRTNLIPIMTVNDGVAPDNQRIPATVFQNVFF
jgi:hypothetical protein